MWRGSANEFCFKSVLLFIHELFRGTCLAWIYSFAIVRTSLNLRFFSFLLNDLWIKFRGFFKWILIYLSLFIIFIARFSSDNSKILCFFSLLNFLSSCKITKETSECLQTKLQLCIRFDSLTIPKKKTSTAKLRKQIKVLCYKNLNET